MVRDLHLLMVEEVHILNKRIIEERHKRAAARSTDANSLLAPTHLDLSHTVHDGLITYKGISAPVICDFLSRENSRKFYDADTSFQIGRIDMVTNTGTYLDSPFHRFEDGKDLSQLELATLVGLDAVVAGVTGSTSQAVGREVFLPLDVRGKAVLVNVGWSRHWATEQYFEGHIYLTRDAAEYLRDAGAALVWSDSYNIDDTTDGARPGTRVAVADHAFGMNSAATAEAATVLESAGNWRRENRIMM